MSRLLVHECHRKLAEITCMATDIKGNLVIGPAEIKLLMPLLRQNLDLIYELDSLKELSLLAYAKDDTAWQHDICRQIDELEAKCT